MPENEDWKVDMIEGEHPGNLELMLYAQELLSTQKDGRDEKVHLHVQSCSCCGIEVERLYSVLKKQDSMLALQPLLLSLSDVEQVEKLRAAIHDKAQSSARMDRRLNRVLRSADGLQVSLPVKDAVCIGAVEFVFAQALQEQASLAIFDDQAQLKIKLSLEAGTCNWVIEMPEQEFPTGLYYWTLAQGKFSITRRLFLSSSDAARAILGLS